MTLPSLGAARATRRCRRTRFATRPPRLSNGLSPGGLPPAVPDREMPTIEPGSKQTRSETVYRRRSEKQKARKTVFAPARRAWVHGGRAQKNQTSDTFSYHRDIAGPPRASHATEPPVCYCRSRFTAAPVGRDPGRSDFLQKSDRKVAVSSCERKKEKLRQTQTKSLVQAKLNTLWFPWKLPETQSAGDPLVSLWVAGNSREGQAEVPCGVASERALSVYSASAVTSPPCCWCVSGLVTTGDGAVAFGYEHGILVPCVRPSRSAELVVRFVQVRLAEPQTRLPTF